METNYINGEEQIRYIGYLIQPKKISDMGGLICCDRSAVKDIKRLNGLIERLKEYRLELSERAQELETMKNHIRVSLIREKHWYDSKIYYHIITEKVYEDGTQERIKSESYDYTGKERHKAINKFEEIKKANPYYEFVKNIEKGA